MFDQLVESILSPAKAAFGQIITFKDDDKDQGGTGKTVTGIVMNPNEVEKISTDKCHGPHIADEWYGACCAAGQEETGRFDFDENDPPYYIVFIGRRLGSWGNGFENFRIVPEDVVKNNILKNKLTPQTKETFGDIIDEL
mgnify:CR=1 FL=1